MVRRLEEQYQHGKGIQPDVACYNAVLNAFGWADDYPPKAEKCYNLFHYMTELYDMGWNVDAKPDLITCNSVLNAAAFCHVSDDKGRTRVLQIATMTADIFLTGKYGHVNHVTFVNLLVAITRHMSPGPRRTALATTAFWQCCQTGNLAVPVVVALHRVLDWDDFKGLLGDAVLSGPQEEKLRFDLDCVPKSWTRHAPRQSERRNSRPSRKRTNFQATRRVSLRSVKG